MNGRLHVVGAGVAGLAAALAAARAGREVRLYEAGGQAGGRCRPVRGASGAVHDNGTHALLGANRQALAFLDAIGAREGWIEPEPEGLPMLDLATGEAHRYGLSPWSWRRPTRRPPGLRLGDLARMVRLALPGRDRPLGPLIGDGPFAQAVLAPLALAALNTPPAEASTRRLARVLRRIPWPATGRLLVARRGLGPDLVAPALAALAAAGVVPAWHHALRRLEIVGGRAARLIFARAQVTLGAKDEVVLALPPHALARILPDLPLPGRYEPIVNLHFPIAYAGPVRLAGLLGGLAQWALFRPGMASVTISAARAAVGLPADALIAQIWPELARAALVVGLDPLPPAAPPDSRAIKERRATISQTAGPLPLPPACPFANLALAGDWLTPLPATIEAAVASGLAAVGGSFRPVRRSAPALTPRSAAP